MLMQWSADGHVPDSRHAGHIGNAKWKLPGRGLSTRVGVESAGTPCLAQVLGFGGRTTALRHVGTYDAKVAVDIRC